MCGTDSSAASALRTAAAFSPVLAFYFNLRPFAQPLCAFGHYELSVGKSLRYSCFSSLDFADGHSADSRNAVLGHYVDECSLRTALDGRGWNNNYIAQSVHQKTGVDELTRKKFLAFIWKKGLKTDCPCSWIDLVVYCK